MACSMDEWKTALAMVMFTLVYAVMMGLVKKAMDEGMSELVIITLRQLVGAIVLFPITLLKERKTRPKLTTKICMYIFMSAILGATVPQFLYFLGMKYTTATFAASLGNLTPVITFLVALLLRLESINLTSKAGTAKIFGAFLSLAGAMVVTLYKGKQLTHRTVLIHASKMVPSGSVISPEKWMLGSIALLGSSFAFALWMLLQAKVTEMYPAVYTGTALMSLMSFCQVALLSLVIERDTSVWLPKGKLEIITVIYSGAATSGMGFVLMTWAVQKRGPVFTSSFLPLVQVYVTLIGFAVLHEPLFFGSVLGSVFLIIGLYILLWGKRKEASIMTAKLPEINQQQQEN